MKITTTAGTLKKGDKVGRRTVRYSTLHDLGHVYLVYFEGADEPERYGRQEAITVELAPRPGIQKPEYRPNFTKVSDADLSAIPWGSFTEARDECFMSTVPTTYTYGAGRGVRTYTSIPFLPWVETLRNFLNHFACTYNVCFFNRYANESNHLGWHSDDSPGMDHKHPIAVISFGQAREIWWRIAGESGRVPVEQTQLLEDGSLFTMPAGFQKTHQHRIPKGDRLGMKPRVSLTFRHYMPTQESSP